jgi:transposase
MSYDEKFHRHVLKIKEQKGLSLAKGAKRFGIGKQTVYNWTKRLLEKKVRNRLPQELCLKALEQDVKYYPDAYQYERAKPFGVSTNCIWRALKRLGVSYKKSLTHPKADPEKRSMFCKKIDENRHQMRPIVFIDESGFAHSMPRTGGYALKGQPCFGVHDWGAKGRTNVIGALLGGVLLTVSLFQTTINTTVFNPWMIQDLIPKLPEKSAVVMDNATFHS